MPLWKRLAVVIGWPAAAASWYGSGLLHYYALKGVWSWGDGLAMVVVLAGLLSLILPVFEEEWGGIPIIEDSKKSLKTVGLAVAAAWWLPAALVCVGGLLTWGGWKALCYVGRFLANKPQPA